MLIFDSHTELYWICKIYRLGFNLKKVTINITDLVYIKRVFFKFLEFLRIIFHIWSFGPRVPCLTIKNNAHWYLSFTSQSMYDMVCGLKWFPIIIRNFRTSHNFPWSIFITQCELAWSCMADPWPSPQHNTMRLNLPFPSSTKFLVYLHTKRRVLQFNIFPLKMLFDRSEFSYSIAIDRYLSKISMHILNVHTL